MKIKDIKKEFPFFVVSLGFVWQALFFYIPLFTLIIISFLKYIPETVYPIISLDNLFYFFKPVYIKIILTSLFFALTNSALCFLVGFPIAYFLAFKAKRLKNIFLFLLILPFWTNFLLHIYAWSYILDKSGFINNLLIYLNIIKEPLKLFNNIFAIVIVMLYCYLPFMILPIYSVLERLNKNILEASADLGASVLTTSIRIILPLSISGITSGFFLVLVPSFAEFAIPSLVAGDKYLFAGTIITQYILSGDNFSLGTSFTLIACLILVLFILFFYLIKHIYRLTKLKTK